MFRLNSKFERLSLLCGFRHRFRLHFLKYVCFEFASFSLRRCVHILNYFDVTCCSWRVVIAFFLSDRRHTLLSAAAIEETKRRIERISSLFLESILASGRTVFRSPGGCTGFSCFLACVIVGL